MIRIGLIAAREEYGGVKRDTSGVNRLMAEHKPNGSIIAADDRTGERWAGRRAVSFPSLRLITRAVHALATRLLVLRSLFRSLSSVFSLTIFRSLSIPSLTSFLTHCVKGGMSG